MSVKISFLLPVYNVKEYVEWCLKSIFATTDIDFEVICCDDCSTDGTYELLIELQNKYNFSLLRNEKNSGVSYTRNRLLGTAKGKYVWFVDPDDMINAASPRLFYNIAEKERSNWIIGNNINIGPVSTKFEGGQLIISLAMNCSIIPVL